LKAYLFDVQDIHDQLIATAKDASFVVFILPEEDEPESAANVQFSIEGGAAGLDWVLLSPVNVRDKESAARYGANQTMPPPAL